MVERLDNLSVIHFVVGQQQRLIRSCLHQHHLVYMITKGAFFWLDSALSALSDLAAADANFQYAMSLHQHHLLHMIRE